MWRPSFPITRKSRRSRALTRGSAPGWSPRQQRCGRKFPLRAAWPGWRRRWSLKLLDSSNMPDAWYYSLRSERRFETFVALRESCGFGFAVDEFPGGYLRWSLPVSEMFAGTWRSCPVDSPDYPLNPMKEGGDKCRIGLSESLDRPNFSGFLSGNRGATKGRCLSSSSPVALQSIH
jgi:hypothetical protein